MGTIIVAAAFFVGIHLFISGTPLRDRLVDTMGEGPYLGLFSLASLGGIIWLCMAYASAPTVVLWEELPGVRWLALIGTLVAFVLVVAGLATPSPTATGGERILEEEGSVQGIQRITRHPFLWGVAIWALVHLLANGDAASLVFFGGLAVLALAGPASIDAKRARRFGAKWQAYADRTSIIPFAAIASGRNELAVGEIGWRLGAGVVVWAMVLASHAWVFGASPFPH